MNVALYLLSRITSANEWKMSGKWDSAYECGVCEHLTVIGYDICPKCGAETQKKVKVYIESLEVWWNPFSIGRERLWKRKPQWEEVISGQEK